MRAQAVRHSGGMETQARIIPLRRSSYRVIVAMVAALILLTAAQIAMPDRLGQPAAFVDFHVFHLAGELALSGDLATAYHAAEFRPVQAAEPGFRSFMPYTYPPPFNLLAALLGALPQGLAYLVFAGGTFAAWLWVLRRLAGAEFGTALMMVLPAAVVSARYGQNGFLSAALVGGFCLLALRGRTGAGVPLGLMSYKPHLGIGIAVAALLRLRFRVLLVAAAVTGALCGLATLAFGAAIWADFLHAAGESAGFLEAGAYPLFRMTSVYAALRSLGADAGAAMALHGVLTLGALGLVGMACLRGWQTRRVLALSVVSCLIVSPYNYDYDMLIASVAIALAAPDLVRAGAALRIGLLAAMWGGTGWGLAVIALDMTGARPPALAACASLAAAALIFAALARGEARAAQADPLRTQPA
ncbi:MAG: glycosyltransferase family 87 protein [Pseudooceanicola sp.]